MEAFLVSTTVVGLAEIGDKTQILSLILAARFQRPVPIIFGILFATIANHVAAGLAGTLPGNFLIGRWMGAEQLYSSPTSTSLQGVSRHFHALAHHLAEVVPEGPEQTVSLRKLLE